MSEPTADTASIPLPKTSKPALRAMNTAGIEQLNDLVSWSPGDLVQLHGMGPKAIGILEEALRQNQMEFAAESRDSSSDELCDRMQKGPPASAGGPVKAQEVRFSSS